MVSLAAGTLVCLGATHLATPGSAAQEDSGPGSGEAGALWAEGTGPDLSFPRQGRSLPRARVSRLGHRPWEGLQWKLTF